MMNNMRFKKCFNLKKGSIILILVFIIGIANNNLILCSDGCSHLSIESVFSNFHYNFVNDIASKSIKQKTCVDILLITVFNIRSSNSDKILLKERILNKYFININNSDTISKSSSILSYLKILCPNTTLNLLKTVILLI